MFKLDDIIIDRIQMGIAESSDGTLLYTLTQLADATIDISAESKDAVDKDGTLIKRFWKGKSGTFTANNAMINLNVLAESSGNPKAIATTANKITMPKIITVKKGATDVTLTDAVEGTIKVNALETNGTMGKSYTKSTAASATAYALSTDKKFTPPSDPEVAQYVVKYNREVSEGISIKNSADKFPSTIKLTLKALCVDPCEADTLRACYIVLPSFQVSPEVSVALQTDTQLEFKGDLQVAYCTSDKSLYEIYVASDDEEE